MDLIFHNIFLQHDTGDHPENKSRLKHFNRLPNYDFEKGEKYLNSPIRTSTSRE